MGQATRDRKIQTDCKQSLRIGKIRALNGCTGRLFRAATRHNHKNSDIKKVQVGKDQEKAQSEKDSVRKICFCKLFVGHREAMPILRLKFDN